MPAHRSRPRSSCATARSVGRGPLVTRGAARDKAEGDADGDEGRGASRRRVLLGSASAVLGAAAPLAQPESAEALVVLPCRLHNRYIMVRHGESFLQVKDRIQSNPGMKYDFTWGLTETGLQQMHAAAEVIENELQISPRWIYTSNFQRAFQSAQVLRGDLYMLHSNLRTEFGGSAPMGGGGGGRATGLLDPRKMGDLEGRSQACYEQVWANDLLDEASRPPPVLSSQEPTASSDSCLDMYRRCTEAISRLEGSYFGEDIVLVSHQDTLSTFCASLYGTDLGRHHEDYPFKHGEVKLVDLTGAPLNGEYDPRDFRGTLPVGESPDIYETGEA